MRGDDVENNFEHFSISTHKKIHHISFYRFFNQARSEQFSMFTFLSLFFLNAQLGVALSGVSHNSFV